MPLLTGYDAKRCQRRVHNDHDPTLEKVPWEVPADLQKRFDDGKAFEAEVFAALREALGSEPVARPVRGAGQAARSSTRPSPRWTAGVELILGGWLPDDEHGRPHRPAGPPAARRRTATSPAT